MKIGAHESVSGGLHTAFERAVADGAEALQIFTRSSRQWAVREITDEEAQLFREARSRTGLPVLAHGSYLVNLAAEPGEVRTRSVAAFRDELERCDRLGIEWLVFHPGAHADPDEGLRLVADAVQGALEATRGARVGVLVEVTAGQGQSVGHRFEHLARLLDAIRAPGRTGVCLDTCHLFAAGYDIGTAEGYDRTVEELDRVVGCDAVRAFHLNDAKKGLGCRVDRHERIGEGTLGLDAFARFLRDPRWAGLPAVVETPEGRWAEEIATLRRLRDGAPAVHAPRPDAAAKKATARAAGTENVAKARNVPHSTRVATAGKSTSAKPRATARPQTGRSVRPSRGAK